MTKLYVCEISNLIEEIKADENAIKAYFDKLESGRIEHIMKHNKAEDRARTLGVSLLLLFALKKKGYVVDKLPDFSYIGNGKPYLTQYPEMKFSLSHTGNIITCAISKNDIGADVEYVREIKEGTVERVFSENEKKMAGYSQEGYVRLWTAKEACVKLIGTGLKDIWEGLEVFQCERGKYIKKLNQDIRKTICYEVIADGCVLDLNGLSYYYSVCAKRKDCVETVHITWDKHTIVY